ncbi:uncharacterized protein B0H18DRAFT_1104867, partial [Fomitopsis serialis]|uniref:uncharacterized protein n=1 Tax=Fomitopsis serialis TaxID=139415 RepID=UPI00200755B7
MCSELRQVTLPMGLDRKLFEEKTYRSAMEEITSTEMIWVERCCRQVQRVRGTWGPAPGPSTALGAIGYISTGGSVKDIILDGDEGVKEADITPYGEVQITPVLGGPGRGMRGVGRAMFPRTPAPNGHPHAALSLRGTGLVCSPASPRLSDLCHRRSPAAGRTGSASVRLQSRDAIIAFFGKSTLMLDAAIAPLGSYKTPSPLPTPSSAPPAFSHLFRLCIQLLNQPIPQFCPSATVPSPRRSVAEQRAMPLAIFRFKLPGRRPSRWAVSVCRGARPACRHAVRRCTPWRACTFRGGRSLVSPSPSMRSLHGPEAHKSSWGLHDRSPIKLLCGFLPLPKVFAPPPYLALTRVCPLVLGLCYRTLGSGACMQPASVDGHIDMTGGTYRTCYGSPGACPLATFTGQDVASGACMHPRVSSRNTSSAT